MRKRVIGYAGFGHPRGVGQQGETMFYRGGEGEACL